MSATSHAVANGSRRRWLYGLVLLASLVAATFSLPSYLQERALRTLPYGFKKFSMSDPLPACARWKDHMPASRDPAAYQLYIEARKVWRSKIAWQFTREEATRILTDVKKAAELGDWGSACINGAFLSARTRCSRIQPRLKTVPQGHPGPPQMR